MGIHPFIIHINLEGVLKITPDKYDCLSNVTIDSPPPPPPPPSQLSNIKAYEIQG
jgi:hypothetical protein